MRIPKLTDLGAAELQAFCVLTGLGAERRKAVWVASLLHRAPRGGNIDNPENVSMIAQHTRLNWHYAELAHGKITEAQLFELLDDAVRDERE